MSSVLKKGSSSNSKENKNSKISPLQQNDEVGEIIEEVNEEIEEESKVAQSRNVSGSQINSRSASQSQKKSLI